MTEKKAATPDHRLGAHDWSRGLHCWPLSCAAEASARTDRFARSRIRTGNAPRSLIAPMPSDIPPLARSPSHGRSVRGVPLSLSFALALASARQNPADRLCQRTSQRSLCPVAGSTGVVAAVHSSRRQLPSTMTGHCRTAMARSPWPTARRWKPAWECMRWAAARRQFPAYRPSSPSRTPFSSLALRTRRWQPGSTPSRPPPTTCFFSRRWRISISLRAFQQQAIAQETLDHTQRLAELTAAFARTGQGNQADADRAQTELALRKNALAQAAAQTNVASARLVELLHLEPTRVLTPQEPTIVPIELGFARCDSGPTGCRRVVEPTGVGPEPPSSGRGRPSLASRAVRAAVAESAAGCEPERIWRRAGLRHRRLSRRDLISTPPCIGNSATLAWATPPLRRPPAHAWSSPGNFRSSSWTGWLGRSSRRTPNAESLRGQIAVAQSGIRVASESYRRNLERIRGGQGLPLEVLQSLQALDQSCREYLRAVGDYDEWQFRLYRALGCPIPQEASPAK